MKSRTLILSIIYCLLLVACSGGESNNKYSNLRARLSIDNVLQASVLHAACESMGEFCAITSDGQSLIFTNAAGKTSKIPLTAMSDYSGYNLGLNSGYIVGRLAIPEMGEDNVRVVCFDRACPNCYRVGAFNMPLKPLDRSGLLLLPAYPGSNPGGGLVPLVSPDAKWRDRSRGLNLEKTMI